MPDEVMVALSERRISLLLDHQADHLVQPGQAAAAIMMSTVLLVSGELKLAISSSTLRATLEPSPRRRG